MHIPFLQSDPDRNISLSRDANTDEGLNTCQIRNFVNHGDLTINKSDNFVKTPLFGAILFVPFKIFGTKLWIGRLLILLISLGICLFIFYKYTYSPLLAINSFVFVFCEFYVFHYCHYCMAEIFSTVFIFLSIFLLIKPYEIQNPLKASFLSTTFISLAYYIKIQFLYDVVILPLILILLFLFRLTDKKLLLKQFLYTIAFLMLYVIVYYAIWYWPNKDFFNYVMADQTSGRFPSLTNLIEQINLNIRINFFNDYLRWFTYSFYFLYIIGMAYAFISKSLMYKALFIGISCWILCELHKLTMTYLPTRYLISLIFAMGLIIALVLNELMILKGVKITVRVLKVFSIIVLLFFSIKNIQEYSFSFKNRTYNRLRIDNYLSQFDFGNNPVIGAWAPSLSWKSKAITYPVWKDYFNDKEVINEQKPAIIITEIDEEDSNQAFSSVGIVIDTYADSIKYFTVNHWNLKLLWIKNQYLSK